jgi:DNA-binding Lrp family transcriptional regulator
MTAAFVFVQLGVDAHDPQKIHSELHAVSGVKTVHMVAGPVDLILYVEVPDQAALTKTLMGIRAVHGVASTDTRIVFPF